MNVQISAAFTDDVSSYSGTLSVSSDVQLARIVVFSLLCINIQRFSIYKTYALLDSKLTAVRQYKVYVSSADLDPVGYRYISLDRIPAVVKLVRQIVFIDYDSIFGLIRRSYR